MKDTIWSLPWAPRAPDWRLDWSAILRQYGWLAELAETPQDALHHAEGDVLTHTCMVLEALVALPEWRALPEPDRSVLLLACLIHDIAKPICTVVEPDGRISSPRHALKGEGLARTLLWRNARDFADIPFLQREQVCKLVRRHGLPLWFFEREDPARAVVSASQTMRLDYLALVAEADVLGRICEDREQLLERVAWFRSYAQEFECYSQAYHFPSEHARFQYLQNPDARLDYAAYDDTRFTVYLMAGVPATGKDTWIAQHAADLPVISLDALREELGFDPGEGSAKAAQVAHERARVYMRAQQPFVWNATNLGRRLRDPLVSFFSAYGARVEIIATDAPYILLHERNRARPDPVPERVIDRMLDKYELPDCSEAQVVRYITIDGEFESLLG
jgi:predicted kinase